MIDALLRSVVIALSPPDGAQGPGALGRVRAAALRVALGALLRRRTLGEVLHFLGSAPAAAVPAADAGRAGHALRRTPATCFVRALGGYAALRARGEDVSFVLGVRTTGDDVEAHAWLERGGAPFGEPGDPRLRFAVVLRHPAPPASPRDERSPSMSPLLQDDDVIFTELRDGTGVLLHLRTKVYYALNATGVAAWKAIAAEGAKDARDVARRIAERFAGAELEVVRRDVEALLAELAAEGLLSAGLPAPPGEGA